MNSFKSSTVYQIYIKSFCDSNGDGIGDLNGIRSKLAYLKSLGVDYVWVTPFFRSPMNDNGYDVSDYYSINPMFGTMADCEAMIREAKELGIGFMFDMVFNHTSTDHEWFRKALAGDPEYMDYYIFRDGVDGHSPTNWESKFGGNAWEYVPALDKWYLHLFDVSQADLNWENPRVRQELKQVIRFWKDKGVSGFRFDVVNLISKPAIFEDDHLGDGRRFYTDGRHVHEFLRELVRDTGIGDMVTVGEMSSTSLDNCIRYTRPEDEELSMCFSFHHLKVDYKDGDKWTLMKPDLGKLRELFCTWQEEMEKAGGWNALFWCNHDQPRAVSRFGNDQEYWKESAKMLATFTHLMRGTPYIYQGEEIGMTNAGFTDIRQYRDVESTNYYRILLDKNLPQSEALEVLAQRSRDNGRTPMQWNAEEQAGFTSALPWLGIPENYRLINAEAEEKDPDSILNYYRSLVRLRKENPIISEGGICFLDTGNDKVFAYERRFEGQILTVICSFSDHRETISEDLTERIRKGRLLIGNYESQDGQQDTVGLLRPYEAAAVWS
ncbi:MAG: alpha,alpha-phosphotrehalase [Blautia sp.]|nr:alpha,alpha-phosphotrehalase [Blautia sp.]